MKRRFWPQIQRPSTRAFIKEARRTRDYSLFDWLHGYVYTRWPYLYIGVGTGEHWLGKILRPLESGVSRLFATRSRDGQDAESGTFADSYHGKVVPLEAALRLVTINEEICLTNLEQVIPYTRARDIIMRNPDHIAVLECPCRSVRPDPCLPLDVCIIVGEPFASFVAEHHPKRARWITQAEAAEILREEHERGHVHHAFFKDAMLGRFYAICNCCACCCGAMHAWRNGIPMVISSGYVSRVDADSCIGCGVCAEFCQFRAISVSDGLAVVDEDACMGCGVCVSKCEQGAMSLLRDASRGEPLVIEELIAKDTSARVALNT